MEQGEVALAKCLVEHCRVGLFPATNNRQSSHCLICRIGKLVCNSVIRAGEQTTMYAKDWKVVGHGVNFVLLKVLVSEPFETISDVQSLVRLMLTADSSYRLCREDSEMLRVFRD